MKQTGIQPNEVIKNVRADAFVIFLDLRSDLTSEQLQDFLRGLTAAKQSLEAPIEGVGQVASAVVAFGRSLFVGSDGQPRFGLDGKLPADLAELPAMPGVVDSAAGAHDLLIYAMSTSEAAVADFERALSETTYLSSAAVERGFQRRDGREPAGFRDGIRNVATPNRDRIIYVNRLEAPHEPPWIEDGSYLAYMKIEQHLSRFAALGEEQQQEIVGRHRDGMRLDLQTPVGPGEEPEFSGDRPAANAHIRKAGPRGQVHDRTEIFRRGVPYLDLHPDGGYETGLQFVSFQRSLDYLDTILNRWMLNDAFPTAGAGADRLFGPSPDGQPLVTIHKAGLYAVPPKGREFIGDGLFAAAPSQGKPRGPGRIALRKSAVDPSGNEIKAELGGAGFQVFRVDTNEPVTELFVTDSAGHATSLETIPLGVEVVVREVQPLPNTELVEEPRLTLTRRQELVRVVNRATQAMTGYSG